MAAWVASAEEPAAGAVGLEALPPLIGRPSSELITTEADTLLDAAWRHRLGFDRVARLNPDLDPWIPERGSVVRLPTEHVPPDAPPRGLVINIPEMQLYDFGPQPEPEVFAIAIGDQMDPSLIGSFRVGEKRERPVWRVPESIRAERPELPAEVPPGPDNPLGDRWMTIGQTSYGIHGTNNRWSIGREATHGCIRLYNDEMERLYARTPTGTPILLVYQTVKLGRRDRTLYVEAHPDLYGREPDRALRAAARLRSLGLLPWVDAGRLERAIAEALGSPVAIGSVPPDAPAAPAAPASPATSRPPSGTSRPRAARRRPPAGRRSRPRARRPRRASAPGPPTARRSRTGSRDRRRASRAS
jgi:L,D-transpeptidase ErfK/SrfK